MAAIMRNCCCCGVRSGSTASGIYSLIIAILGGIVFTLDLVNITPTKQGLVELANEFPEVFGDLDIDAYINAQLVSYIFALIFLVSVFFTSIVLMVGISKDSKDMLIPFMVAKGVGLIWYVYGFSVNIYAVVAMGMQYAGIFLLIQAIVLVPFFAGDLVCLLCVTSQYQEYRDGRGRFNDIAAAQGQTTLVIHEHQLPPGSGAFAYQHMQEQPPNYSSAYTPPPAGEKGVPDAI